MLQDNCLDCIKDIFYGKNQLKYAEYESSKKILKIIEQNYYFSEERKEEKEVEDTYVMYKNNESRMLVKLYKWEQCCEYCYLQRYTLENCSR